MLSELSGTKFRVVGTGEVIKAIKAGNARAVFIAKDADQAIIEPVFKLCEEKKIKVLQAESMKDLGAACGIQIGAASAALLREVRRTN